MLMLHSIALYAHIIIGSLALLVFWLPVFSRKGGRLHVKAGQVFVYGMWAVAISGVLMSSIVWWDPLAIRFPNTTLDPARAAKIVTQQTLAAEFLFMLSLLVMNSVQHGMLVLKAKTERRQLRHWSVLSVKIALLITALLVGIKGIMQQQILLQIFAPISLLSAITGLHYTYKTNVRPREWILEHFSGLIGCGIGAYTAFFAFGGRAYLQDLLPGVWQVLPWVLPGIIGTLATLWLKPKYRRQYRVQAPAPTLHSAPAATEQS
ncbi:MAG: hypothetical protein HWE11_02995 [Gammaproteobacteria bacterium]|nr:hypothetical protein [Gammaproteobacteria bacterium]